MGNKKELTEIHGVPFIPPFSTNIGIVQEQRGAILMSLQILEATFKYIVSHVRIKGNDKTLAVIHGFPPIPPFNQTIGIAQERRSAILSSLQILGTASKYIVGNIRIMGNNKELTKIHRIHGYMGYSGR